MANVVEVIIKQSGQGNAIQDANKALGGLSGAASGAVGSLGKFGGALGSMATIAGGIVAANIFGKIAEGISSFVTTGLNAVGANQQLEVSLKSLLTSNLMYSQSTETVTQAVTKQIMSQDEYGLALDGLNAKLVTQKATFQEQQEAIRQLTDRYGDNGLAVIEAKAKHEQLGVAIRGTEHDIATLTATETTYSTSTKTSWQQTMNQADAFKIASGQTKDLLDFVSKLAVVSPFETEDVEMTTKYAIAAGLGVDATKEFVPAFLDLAGAVGISSSELGFAADQLFQVKKVGKLTEIDLRQLRRVGIDLSKVIGVEMGMSVDEFNKKAETTPGIFDDLFDAVTRFSQNTFSGTSKEMALSVKGLQSTLNDVFVIGSRTFLRPLVDAFTPAIAGIVGKLSDFVLGGDLKGIGENLADTLMGGIARFQKFGLAGIFLSAGFTGVFPFFKKLGALFGLITGDAGTLADTVKGILGGAFEWLATNIFPTLSTAIQFIIDHFEEFKGALMGIGGVLAVGALAGIAAAILSLLTPINLIIAGAALLGAAWAGNWGDIQGKVAAAWTVIQPIFDNLKQRADLVIFTFEKFGAGAGFAMFGQMVVGVINQIIPGFSDLVSWLQMNIPIAVQVLSDIWTNTLLPGFQRVWEAIQTNLLPLFQQLFTWLASEGPGIAQVLGDAWTNIILPALAAVGDFLLNTLFPMWVELQVWLAESIPAAIQTLSDFWTNTLLPAITSAGTFITDTLIPTLTNLWTWLSTNIALAIQTVSDIWTTVFMPAITGVWTFISTLIIPLFQSVADLMGAVLGVAITAMAGLWQNVLLPALMIVWSYYTDNIMTVLSAVAVIIDTVLGVAITKLTNLWRNTLLPAITAVWDFISKTLMPVFIAAGDTIDNDVAPPISNLVDEVLPALSSGLATVVKWIKDATGFFNSLASAVKNFQLPAVLTPGSPPPFAIALQDIAKAANQAGTAVSGFSQATLDSLIGVNRGIASNLNAIGAARDDVEKFFDNSSLGGAKAKFALAALSKVFREHSDEILTATDRQAKFQELLNQFGPNFEKADISGGQMRTVTTAMGLWLNFFDKRKKELVLAQQRMFIEAGKTALNIGSRLNDIVQGSVDILDMRVETLQGLVSSGMAQVNFQGMIISQAQAQELLNAALAEQLDIQDDIFQLNQNEQKLGFLEKQLALIDTLNEAGLNVKDILGGITLGLDASIPDMIEATNRLVMAMIDQVNKDLQLASPSKVLFKKFQLAGMGAVQGLMSMKPMLEKAIGPVIDPLMSAGNGAVSSRTTNNYFNQTVNTRAESSTVIGDFRTMQMLIGA